jgi:hypothetical protein
VVTPTGNYVGAVANFVTNNPVLHQQMTDFASTYVPQKIEMPKPAKGNIEPSYPEELIMPDVPLIWIAGKFFKPVVKNVLKKMSGFGGGLKPSQIKAITSYEKLIQEHEDKLAAYIANPYKYDNKGLLKNAPNDAVRQKIIDARVHHLKHEIQTFRENITKILNE